MWNVGGSCRDVMGWGWMGQMAVMVEVEQCVRVRVNMSAGESMRENVQS